MTAVPSPGVSDSRSPHPCAVRSLSSLSTGAGALVPAEQEEVRQKELVKTSGLSNHSESANPYGGLIKEFV